MDHRKFIVNTEMLCKIKCPKAFTTTYLGKSLRILQIINGLLNGFIIKKNFYYGITITNVSNA